MTELVDDGEIDDEVQDWSNFNAKTSSSLPKRGEKDYEPDGTSVQLSQLEISQNSMFSALKSNRGHIVKQNIKCFWNEGLRKGLITRPKGSFLQTVGSVDSSGNCWLNLNEFVYLSERGTIEPWYDGKDVSLDLNSCYALAFKDEDEIDQYHVYSHLKRHGYIVMDYAPRTVAKKDNRSIMSLIWDKILQSNSVKTVIALISKLWNPAFHSLQFVRSKYTSYRQIFESIKLIPYRQDEPIFEETGDIDPKITFNVWKPNPQFSKKNPPLPNFQMIVLNVNNYKLPTLLQLKKLFNQNNVVDGYKNSSQLNKLKNGQGNVILAVVDYGVINFVKISQGVFNDENMYEETHLKSRKKWSV